MNLPHPHLPDYQHCYTYISALKTICIVINFIVLYFSLCHIRYLQIKHLNLTILLRQTMVDLTVKLGVIEISIFWFHDNLSLLLFRQFSFSLLGTSILSFTRAMPSYAIKSFPFFLKCFKAYIFDTLDMIWPFTTCNTNYVVGISIKNK